MSKQNNAPCAPQFSEREIRKVLNTSIQMPMKVNYRIFLKHLGGERREVEVISEAANSLYIIWPLCGSYRLDLRKNILIGTKRRWEAEDIQKAWDIYNELSGNLAFKKKGG